MASLSRDLQDYLSKSDNKSKSFTFSDFQSENLSKWFHSTTNDVGYEKVPTSENTPDSWFGNGETSNDCLPTMSRTQRTFGFVSFIAMGIFCMGLATFYIPVLVIKARKFALLYTLGSLFLVSSFSMLWGPINHLKHLFSAARLPFTLVYFGTLMSTLYFALMVQSTLLTVICALAQALALVWYIVSYIPGGQTGLKFFTKIFSSAVTTTVSKTLPV